MKLTHRITVAAAALALAVTPAAFAKKSDDDGTQGGSKVTKPDTGPSQHPEKGKGNGKAKPKNVVLKGTVVSSDAAAGTVTVHVVKATKWGKSLVDTDAAFTVTKINAADTDGDGSVTVADLMAGDKVVVQARIAKDDVAPYKARKVVDQTHPKSSDDDEAED
jgi:hypothetical protein